MVRSFCCDHCVGGLEFYTYVSFRIYHGKVMKLTDKRFWTAWWVMLLIMAVCCLSEGWREDTALLGGAYALSLLSTWLCHKVRPGIAFVNLIVMISYNAILSCNLVFNSQNGAGLTWWFFALLLNTVHSIALLIYCLFARCKSTGLSS